MTSENDNKIIILLWIQHTLVYTYKHNYLIIGDEYIPKVVP